MIADESEDVGKLDVAEASEVGTACHMLLELALKTGVAPPLAFNWPEQLVGQVLQVVTRNDGTEHARLSPSGAERWTSCPGSVVLLPRVVGSAPRSVGVPVTADMVEWVDVALRWVLEYLRDNPGCVVYSEERAKAGVPFGCPDDMWGTADVVIVNRPKLELVVADAKFGYVEVLAAGNKQVRLYAIGLAHDFGWAFNTYRNVILQPRSEEPVKVEVLNESGLREELERLRPKVEEALAQWDLPRKQLKLVPTDEGCKWCEAAPVCPKLQERTLQLARREFSEPELLSREQLVLILTEADRVRAALNAAEAHALQLLALGQDVPGFKRVLSRKRRVWADEGLAARTLELLGHDARKTVMAYTPAQAEKKVGKRFSDLLQDCIVTPEGEPTLVRDDDPRLPLEPDFDPC